MMRYRLRFLHKKSGKIENEAFLNLPKVKGAKAPKQVLKMAEAGLKIIYLQISNVRPPFYVSPRICISAGGEAKRFRANVARTGESESNSFDCCHRIREQKQTPLAALEDFLKVRLLP
jgi:hypothetical protein